VRVVQPHLRPLGAGEVLDKAVTLFVQRFSPLVLTLAVAVVPIAIVSYIVHPPDAANAWSALFHPVTTRPGHETDVLRQALKQYGTPPFLLGFVVTTLLAFLTNTACAIVAAAGYRSTPVTVVEALRRSLPRLAGQVVAALLFLALGLGLLIAIFVMVLAASAFIGLFVAASKSAVLFVGLPIGLIVFVAILAFSGMLLLAWELAFVTVALDEPRPVRAVGRALRLTFSAGVFLRSLLVGAILIVLYLVFGLMEMTVESLVAGITHLNVLAAIIDAVGDLLIGALLTCYYVAYWFDVRVRREGVDLAIAAQVPA